MIERTINAVIVFPKLPVTPTVTSWCEGSPAKAWQIRAWAAVAFGTITWSRPASGQGRSTTTPAAPRSSASRTKRCPSYPGRASRAATNTWPGSSRR